MVRCAYDASKVRQGHIALQMCWSCIVTSKKDRHVCFQDAIDGVSYIFSRFLAFLQSPFSVLSIQLDIHSWGFVYFDPPTKCSQMFPNQEIGACDPLLFWDPIGSLADGWLRFQLADAFNPKTFENFVYIYVYIIPILFNPNLSVWVSVKFQAIGHESNCPI